MLALPEDSITDASTMKENIIWVSLTLAINRWLYFSGFRCFLERSYSLMLANWYEFLSLAAILRIALPLAGIFRFEGIETNSTGDVC